ncbi:MAG: hypothetical protein CVU09_06785 [Bacteroidetes bacterium HGW-Bacteroidetes-4]|jgi:DNA-directed RNA polymerase specialized sigma24 family protein|nr:MAG: hypothetical protein CVU09_06785 [Bacteroidetes bacterium HGW-Bacteroidetes-4]
MSNTPGEKKVIEEILNGNQKVLTTVYKNVYKHMERFSVSMNSSVLNAKEAVQDAFEIFYRQILDGNLELSCSVETYIISIAKRVFLKHEINWNYQFQEQESELDSLVPEDEQEQLLIEKTIEEKKDELFQKTYRLLPPECQQLLSLTIEGYTAAEIARMLNHSSVEHTRNKRMKCKKYLIEKIKENPDYEKLRNANPKDFELPLRRNERPGENKF